MKLKMHQLRTNIWYTTDQVLKIEGRSGPEGIYSIDMATNESKMFLGNEDRTKG